MSGLVHPTPTSWKTLADLLRQLYSLALQYNLSIRAQHRLRVDNVLADFLPQSAGAAP